MPATHTPAWRQYFSCTHTVNTIWGTSVTAADCSERQRLPTKPNRLSSPLMMEDGGEKKREREKKKMWREWRGVGQWIRNESQRTRCVKEWSAKWSEERKRAEDLTVTVKERKRERVAVTKGERPGEQRCSEGGFNQRKWDQHAVVGCYLHKLGRVELEGGRGNVWVFFSKEFLGSLLSDWMVKVQKISYFAQNIYLKLCVHKLSVHIY